MQSPFTRTLALAFSGFLLVNIAARLAGPRLDSTLWLLDMSLLPHLAAGVVVVAGGILLGLYAVRPAMDRRRRAATLLLAGSLLAIAIGNAVQVQMLSTSGRIASLAPLSISAITALLLLLVLIGIVRGPRPASVLRSAAALGIATACIGAFPLAQILIFGKTDYRRSADAVVVLGARVYADGRPSDALADRVRTACELVVHGYAPLLIVSGGRGDGDIHETEAMRRMAIELGVAPGAIVIDADGANTRATIGNLAQLAREHRLRRVLAVSHFYHLPRIKLVAQRRGLEVYTVPAKETYTLSRLPWFIAREVIACWAYYLNPAAARVGAAYTRALPVGSET